MNGLSKHLTAVALAFAVFGAAALETSAISEDSRNKSLDGLTFRGETGEANSDQAEADVFTFTKGTFHSRARDQYGFSPGPYTTEIDEEMILFVAVTQSATEGTMTWVGSVDEGEIEGYVPWEKPGQEPIEYWFYGSDREW